MALRFVLFLLLVISNKLICMDLLPASFPSAMEFHKDCLSRFIHSNPSTIENNIQEMIALVDHQPMQKDESMQEPLNKALISLVKFWNPKFEKNGLRIARILIEAGADPSREAVFSEINCWGKDESRGSETSYKSTALKQAQGNLLDCLRNRRSG